MKISLSVNGTTHELDVAPARRLLDVLRDDLGLTGVKEGCGEGECGTCTVLLDGEPVNSCLVPVGQCDGREVRTIEGVVDKEKLSPLARAFVERSGVQCGFCTPGMIISAEHLLRHNPSPTEEQIREALAGNICRCTGYTAIVEAVQQAAEQMASDSGEKR